MNISANPRKWTANEVKAVRVLAAQGFDEFFTDGDDDPVFCRVDDGDLTVWYFTGGVKHVVTFEWLG